MAVQRVKSKIFAIVLFALFCAAIFWFLYSKAGGDPPFSDSYKVTAVVPESFNLVTQADVRLGGDIVGKVVEVDNEGGLGKFTFEVEDEYVPLYQDATVAMRIVTLVGETYVDLDPGTAEAGELPDGSTITLEQAEETVPLETVLDTLDAETRKQVQRNLQSLGGAFDGQGIETNRLFASMEPTVADGSELLAVLRGQREQLGSGINDMAAVMQALADRTTQVQTLAVQAKNTAEAVASRDEALRATFQQLPSTLAQARGTLDNVGDFSGGAIPVISDLRLAAIDLGPTLRDLQPAAASGRRLFDELPSFIDAANPMLNELPPFTRELDPAVGSLDAFLRQINPAINYLKDYDNEVGAFWPSVGDALATRDAIGNQGRINAFLSPTGNEFAGPQGAAFVKAYNAFADAGLLENFTPSAAQGNHYPLPGTAGDKPPGAEQNFQRIDPGRR